MIRLRDTATLALTKLRTRKVRLFITIMVSGVLFTGLVAASMVARGAFSSIEDFSDEGFSSRYLMTGFAMSDPYMLTNDETIIARATAIHKETVNKKKIEAKRLGITYDAATDIAPVQEYDIGNGTKQRSLDFNHPAGKQAIKEHLATNKMPGLAEFKASGESYGATAYYENKARPYASDGSSVQVLKDGKETYSQQNGMNGPPAGIDSFLSFWSSMSSDLLDPFLLPGQSLEKTDDGAVPIVIPVDAAEQLLGMAPLPGSAKSAEKLERIKEIRSKAANLRFSICYRNSSSASLISSATSVQQEIELNKTNKDYVKPELIYGLPTEACGTSPVIRDVRNAETKKQTAKQEEFDRIFGKTAPDQKKVAFRVVGVVPSFDFGAASSVSQIVSSLLVSSLGSGWYTPNEYLESDPVLSQVFYGEDKAVEAGNSYIAEFTNTQQALAFEENENCDPDYSVPQSTKVMKIPCRNEGKLFSISAYGSNSLGLESAKRGFGRFFTLAALVVALIAAVIMMGTVGRMIADSRRETAVFRAIGAKKLDIAQIYVLYTIMLSLLIVLFSIIVGGLLAAFVHNRFSEGMTVQALVAYNAQDLDRVFKLYNFYPLDLLYLAGLTLAAGIISSVIPLLRNLRRNPIRDMRDDT